MKRTKLVASLLTCVMCLSFLVVGVFAAVYVNFGLTGKLTFNPEGVYVEISGQMYRGENYGTLEVLSGADYVLTKMTNFDEVDGEPVGNLPMSSWNTPNVTLVPGRRAVKYRIEVTNVSEAGIRGTAIANITGTTGTPTTTTAGGVKTSVYTNCTVTEYAQYIQNIQPNDTQVYELVIELNENASSATIDVSIEFTFTDFMSYVATSEATGFSHSYINIGNYPQRYVGNEMNEKLEEWHKTQTQIGEYTIYKGVNGSGSSAVLNDPEDCPAYKYIDDNIYVRLYGVNYTSYYLGLQNYMNGDSAIKGDTVYAWFKVEPIKWQIITEDYNNQNLVMLLSEYALASGIPFYYNSDATDAGNYKNSTIREFLTNIFYTEAFNSISKSILVSREITDEELDPNDNISSNTAVNDYVWLPTVLDLTNDEYGFDTGIGTDYTDNRRKSGLTDFALATGGYIGENYLCEYWLSSANGGIFGYAVYDTTEIKGPMLDSSNVSTRPGILINF